jgi:serine/threonine protein kinase
MPLSSGERLGHYKILSMIGKGGMGEVYLDTDTRLGRSSRFQRASSTIVLTARRAPSPR